MRVGLVSVVAADGGIPRLARGGLAEQAQQLGVAALLEQGRRLSPRGYVPLSA
jgi:hypothetical protein